MGKNGKGQCDDVLKKIVVELEMKELNIGALKKLIMMEVGTDERTIKKYITLMGVFNYLYFDTGKLLYVVTEHAYTYAHTL